jgi:hypothetical protein
MPINPAILADADKLAQSLYAQQFSQGIMNPKAVLAAREAQAMGAGPNPANPSALIPGGVQPPGGIQPPTMSQAGFSGYPSDPKARALQRAQLLQKLKELDALDAPQGAASAPSGGNTPTVMPSLPMSQ